MDVLLTIQAFWDTTYFQQIFTDISKFSNVFIFTTKH
jgi:hypothetical protein